MSKKLFVSNLDFSITSDQLKEIFAALGEVVSVVVASDRETQRSKGFAFVEMSSDELADKAIEKLNGTPVAGRPIKVAVDRGRNPAPTPSVAADGEQRRGDFLPAVARAQLFRRRKKLDPFLADPSRTIDYKDVAILSKFISERGKIYARRQTGLNAYNQRKVAKAIKRAQNAGLMSFTTI